MSTPPPPNMTDTNSRPPNVAQSSATAPRVISWPGPSSLVTPEARESETAQLMDRCVDRAMALLQKDFDETSAARDKFRDDLSTTLQQLTKSRSDFDDTVTLLNSTCLELLESKEAQKSTQAELDKAIAELRQLREDYIDRGRMLLCMNCETKPRTIGNWSCRHTTVCSDCRDAASWTPPPVQGNNNTITNFLPRCLACYAEVRQTFNTESPVRNRRDGTIRKESSSRDNWSGCDFYKGFSPLARDSPILPETNSTGNT